MAWLSATLETDSKVKAEPVNRMKQIRDRGDYPALPHNPAPYLTDWLFDVGPTCASGMGEGVITYTELANWQAISGVELEPWEARLLRRLSAAYAGENYEARKRDHPAPFGGDKSDLEVSRDRVSLQLKAVFGGRGD